MFFFKKKTTKEKIAAKRTNYAGESMDKLDASGNLPFGWVVHNQKYVDMIDFELQTFRKAVYNAKTDIEKYGALKSYVIYLEEGRQHYNEIGECVGKYFEEYICKSEEAKEYTKKYRDIEKKLKGQK